jgi:hypothetical protein
MSGSVTEIAEMRSNERFTLQDIVGPVQGQAIRRDRRSTTRGGARFVNSSFSIDFCGRIWSTAHTGIPNGATFVHLFGTAMA